MPLCFLSLKIDTNLSAEVANWLFLQFTLENHRHKLYVQNFEPWKKSRWWGNFENSLNNRQVERAASREIRCESLTNAWIHWSTILSIHCSQWQNLCRLHAFAALCSPPAFSQTVHQFSKCSLKMYTLIVHIQLGDIYRTIAPNSYEENRINGKMQQCRM